MLAICFKIRKPFSFVFTSLSSSIRLYPRQKFFDFSFVSFFFLSLFFPLSSLASLASLAFYLFFLPGTRHRRQIADPGALSAWTCLDKSPDLVLNTLKRINRVS